MLIPRPESEDIIELAKEINPAYVLDIGTGSGCLAITIKLELPNAKVIATDISEKALKVCKQNTKNYKVKIETKKADLIDNVDLEKIDLIIANLPYVPNKLITSPEIKTEPKLALFAGNDGMRVYKNLWTKISKSKYKPKYIITESLKTQHKEMTILAKKPDYKLEKTQTLIQVFVRS